MIIIPVKSKTFGECNIFIDGEDFQKIKDRTWHIVKGYAQSRLKNKKISMHRIIMDCPDGMCVDHINHNKLDNRKENLRICTHQENLMNSKKSKDNTSGYKGAYLTHTIKNGKKYMYWLAKLNYNNKPIYIGLYKTAKEAGEAYNIKAIELYGEFACLNEI